MAVGELITFSVMDYYHAVKTVESIEHVIKLNRCEINWQKLRKCSFAKPSDDLSKLMAEKL